MTRLRFAWRLAVRSLTRSRRHAVLVVAAIAVPLMVATAALTATSSSALSPLRELDATIGPAASALVDAYQGARLVQSPEGAADPPRQSAADPMTVARYEDRLRAALAPNQQLHRWTALSARWTTGDGRYRDGGALIETDLDDPAVAQAVPLASGHLPTRPGQVVVDHAVAAQLRIGVGSTLTVSAPPGSQDGAAALPRTQVTVVGVASPIPGASDRLDGFALPGTALAPPETALGPPDVRWLITGGPVTWAQVKAINDVGSVVLSRAVLASPPPHDQVSYTDTTGSSMSRGDVIALQLIGVGVLGLIALLVAPAFTVSARRAHRDLGLLAATGARSADLRMAVGLQGVSAGMAATVIGVGGGLLVAAAIRLVVHLTGSVAMPDLRVPWAALVVVAVLGIVGPTVAASWPARHAAREDPVTVLAQRHHAPVRRRVRTSPILATVAIGTLGAGAGVMTHSPAVLAGGSLVLLAGTLLTLGPLIGRVALVAPHLTTPARYALRDADRHRARTVPAVAGVLAACTLAIATGAFVASLDAHDEATYHPPSGRGTIRVSSADLPSDEGSSLAEPSATQWAAMTQTVRDHFALTGTVLPVYAGVATGTDAGPNGVWIEPAVGTTPLPTSTVTYPATWQPATQPNAPLVDDGTVIARSGLPGAAEAAAALAAGRVVVAHASQIEAGGSARFTVAHASTSTEVTVPATAVDLGTDSLRLIVPPGLAGRFSLTIVQVGLLATATTLPNQDTQHSAEAALGAVVPGITVAVERGPQPSGGTDLALLVGAAVFLALTSAGMCAALAAADSVPDLATLAAVGARRRLRRRIAAAQTGVITLVGVWLGTPIGLLFAVALVSVRRYTGADGVDATWQLHLPWGLLALVMLAIPAITLAGAWFLTPGRLPTTRRVGT